VSISLDERVVLNPEFERSTVLTVFVHGGVFFEASEAYAACDLADILTEASQIVTPHHDLVRLLVRALRVKLDCNITVVVCNCQACS